MSQIIPMDEQDSKIKTADEFFDEVAKLFEDKKPPAPGGPKMVSSSETSTVPPPSQPPPSPSVSQTEVAKGASTPSRPLPSQPTIPKKTDDQEPYPLPLPPPAVSPKEVRLEAKPFVTFLKYAVIAIIVVLLAALVIDRIGQNAEKREIADRQSIDSTIHKWNAIKRDSSRTNSAADLTTVLSGNALSQKQAGLNYNRNANIYWDVETHSIMVTSIRFLGKDSAEALVEIIESGKEYAGGRLIERESYSRDHYEAYYLLERQDDNWKIVELRKNRSL